MIYTMFMDKMAPGILRLSVMDNDLDLFEGQYPVPQGVSYNSYLIEDDQLCLLDTVDARKQEEWLAGLDEVLAGRKLDYLVISHMEPDHAGSIAALCARQPQLKLVANARTFAILDQFSGDNPLAQERVTVADGGTLALGSHTLHFVLAPMVHWPEVMAVYEDREKVLFSADGFGNFGSLTDTDAWADEARRYYGNIVGKYGAQVQGLLKKAAALEIRTICPLHGPQLSGEALDRALTLYGLWAAWKPEQSGVLVAYASFHGHTAEAAKLLAEKLHAQGETVEVIDLNRVHKSYAVSAAFKYDRMALCATTYDSAYAPAMEAFLSSLKLKGMQGRKVALVENGTWAPMAAKHMRAVLDTGKDIVCVCFSSALSTTYQSATIAADDLRADYPEREIYVVDSLSASLGQGLLLYLTVQQKRAGLSAKELADWVVSNRLSVDHWFTVDDLNYLKRGGRVSATSALLGTMLSIKPVMHTSDEGKLVPVGKVRGRKASLNALIDKIGELGIAPEKQTMFICQADCEDEARWVADQIKARYGTPEVHINFIGPVIGSHTGPNTIGIFFVGKER